ncbi:hypothetical protein ACFOMD_05940 [Sphingoaurantiacus capsulatus]|uniref:Uncharacterized protein n=1 Tax=Sphingoaurantiacus capsulatus TaxID=1771310 RepID=A0ABV7X7H6_9SPHN
MRDSIDLIVLAEHGHQWVEWLGRLGHRIHLAFRWAGAAFATKGMNSFL